MMRSRLHLLLLLPVLLLLMAFRQAPLVNPAPIPLGANVTPSAVVKSIKLALLKRGWVATAVKPGEVDATLHLRDHVAKIEIDYDSKAIQIKYVDSVNLKYEVKHGTTYIHKNYLSWINNLVLDIRSNLILLGG